jgi:hypothetical protein
MLTVYTSMEDAEQFLDAYPDTLNWSDCTIAEIVAQSETVVEHHSNVSVFLGYLDGWMLSLTDEIRLRPIIRKFAVCLVSRYPVSLSLAWKNECALLYIQTLNGLPNSDHNGSTCKDTVHAEHRQSATQSTDRVSDHKGGKAGCSAPRRKLKRSNQAQTKADRDS